MPCPVLPPRPPRLRSRSLAIVLALLVSAAASADPVPADAVLARLPFEQPERAQRVIVDLSPEGSSRPMPLMLDTGAQWSLMTPRLARSLGVRVRRLKDTPYRRETRLGRDLQFFVDTSSSDTGAYWEVGVLGGQFLWKYVVEIDYDVQEVRLLDPDRYRVPEEAAAPDEAVLPLRLVAYRPFVDVGLGDRAHRMLVDTGNPWTLDLRDETARELGLEPRSIEGLDVGGLYGPLDARFAVLPELALGAQTLHDVPVLALRGDYNERGATGATLGHDVLSQFVVRIDYPRRRMWLRRIEGRRPSFLGYDAVLLRRVGLLARPVEVGLEVDGVVEGGAAARLGLRPGHRIPLGEDREDVPADASALAERIEAGGPVAALRKPGPFWEEERLGGAPAEEAAADAAGTAGPDRAP